MRVLYSFPHTLGKPGIGTTAFHQVQGLVEHGVDVHLYCTSIQSLPVGTERVVETMVAQGLRVPHRALGVYRAYRYHDWRVARALERLGAEIDVVHCWPAACLQTIAVAKELRVKSVREAPSAHTESAYESARAEAESLGLELPKTHSHRFNARHLEREREEFRRADVLLVPSEYVERTFLERGFAPSHLARHRYGFDPNRFFPGSANARPYDGPLTATFVGRGEPNKGLHYALQAWIHSGAAEDGRFLVCGTLLPSYREQIADLLDHPSVELLGFVPRIASVLQAAHVLVLPTVTEGSALVTYEAFGCGCVLVVSDASGSPCRHLEDGLVHAAGDVATLTKHIRLLNENRNLLAKMRTATLARREEFTWSQAARKLVEIYEKSAGRTASAASLEFAITQEDGSVDI